MKLTPGRLVVIIALAVNGLIVMVGLYLAFWPMKSLAVNGQDEIINPGKTVKPGEVLVYRINYCKYTTAQASLQRSLVGDVTYPLPAATNNIPPGCRTAISRNVIIPDVEPGTYHLELAATYQLNPLRSVTVRSVTEEFTVTKPVEAVEDAPTAETMNHTTQTPATPLAASPAATVPFGTDPVTQEPTQPTPNPQPGLVPQIIRQLRSLLGQ